MDGGTSSGLALNATERRVLGVLIEKGLTTPEYYPMTVNALVAGCNQKNNRDPVTSLDEETVMEGLRSLEQKQLVLSFLGGSSRVTRWRQELARTHELTAVELAIVGELLLRGAPSEGDLRGRASRMRPIETLEALRELLQRLREPTEKRPPFVVRLSPEGSARGARWTHALQPPEQLREIVAAEASAAAAAQPTPDLLARIAQLEERVARLEQRSN